MGDPRAGEGEAMSDGPGGSVSAKKPSRVGVLGMHARQETREAFERAVAHGDDAKAIAMAFYVDAGWERYWPYEDMPEWLKPMWWPVKEKP